MENTLTQSEKLQNPGDFRVQDDHGGTVEIHERVKIEFGLASLEACPYEPIYARIDIVKDNNLEIEPMRIRAYRT